MTSHTLLGGIDSNTPYLLEALDVQWMQPFFQSFKRMLDRLSRPSQVRTRATNCLLPIPSYADLDQIC